MNDRIEINGEVYIKESVVINNQVPEITLKNIETNPAITIYGVVTSLIKKLENSDLLTTGFWISDSDIRNSSEPDELKDLMLLKTLQRY